MSTETEKQTPQQWLARWLYRRLRDRHDVRLTREQFNFHLGHFRDILNKDQATPLECALVIERIVERLPEYQRMDAVQALQDVRLGKVTPAALASDENASEDYARRENAKLEQEWHGLRADLLGGGGGRAG